MGLPASAPAWIGDYIGIQFFPHGRTRSGWDCWGLLRLIWAEHFGIAAPSHDGPSWEPGTDPKEIERLIAAESARYPVIAPGEERCGDGIVLHMPDGDIHIALVIAPGWMLHVEEASGTVVEEYRSLRWARRVVSFHRPEAS